MDATPQVPAWKQALRRRVVAQFQRPSGPLGVVAGFVLAHRPSNRKRNLWTVGLLGVQPADHVLELGYGPGVAIEACARRARQGRVVGIDHSETMRDVASRRNARAVAEGRVELHAAPFSVLEAGLPGSFDKILAVNALFFADAPDALLRILFERLRPGGRLAITFQSRRPGATSADTQRGAEEIAGQLRRCGFTDLRTEILPLEPVSAACVLGSRPVAVAPGR